MKRFLIAVMLVSTLVIVGCATESEARGGNPCDTFLGSVLNECSPHTVDTDTDTHLNGKDQEDLKVNVGVKAVVPIKNLKDTAIEVTGKKDLNQTNLEEGYEIDVIYAKKFDGVDLSFLNPFSWFKKDVVVE
jgi:hypothetical protein